MSLREEKSRQKLIDLLETLKLSPNNKKLAEEYLEEGQKAELLKQVEKQDFSKLDNGKCRKSVEYIEYLKKRNHTESLERYIQLMAAIGGSTAIYLYRNHGWIMQIPSLDCLSQEQRAALYAENLAWESWGLKYQNNKQMEWLFETGREHPEVLYQARTLCYHEYANAEFLLIAIYLFSVRTPIRRVMRREEIQKAVEHQENNLIKSLPQLYPSSRATQEELKELVSFLKQAERNTDLPKEVLSLIRGKKFNSYLITLLSGTAFLTIEYSSLMWNFLRVAMMMDIEDTLEACRNISPSGSTWFKKHLKALEEVLPVTQKEEYMGWCLRHKQYNALRRMAMQSPGIYQKVAESSTTNAENYVFLLEQAKEGNPELYDKMKETFEERYQNQLANEMLTWMKGGKTEAIAYLRGEAEWETLSAFVSSWRSEYYYTYGTYEKLLKMEQIDTAMYERGVVLLGLALKGGFFSHHYFTPPGNSKKEEYQKLLSQKMKKLIEIWTRGRLPLVNQIDALSNIYENIWHAERQAQMMDAAVEELVGQTKNSREELRKAAGEATPTGRSICIRVLDAFWQEEKETLLACATDSSKQVREVLEAVLANHREWEVEIKAMLVSKKMQERELAVRVIKRWGVAQYQEELAQALEKEKSKKLKALLQECLGIEAITAQAEGEKLPKDLATELLKGGKSRKVAWAYETPFSQVHKLDGSVAEEKYLQALLVAYADKTVPGISAEAAQLAKGLHQEELAQFVSELFSKWLESGAEAKKKWVLYAFSVHGGDGAVPVLTKQLQDWAQHSRGALAAEAVRAMAFNGGSQALLQVDQIARKFKFRQVKTAAAAALEAAATALGISREQLEDRIVPNLGFDESLKRTFDYGTRSFQVYLTPTLELEVFDEGGKRLKNLPAPGKRDEEEKAAAAYQEFKQFKKQLKTVTANQKLRLEQALFTERLWNTEQWEELFVKNPVMHQFAIGLIWGIYEEGVLKETFRYMEDGSFNTREEEELELNGWIGLVHPIELSAEELTGWKEQLADYEITQPIEQLDRPVYRVTEEEKKEKELTRFGGKLLNGLSLSGKLLGMGWYRGVIEDAGCFYTFYHEQEKLGVEVEFSGCGVGYESEEEIIVYGVSFYPEKISKKPYGNVKQWESTRLPLEEVDPRYFSEIVLQLHKATASSQEQLAYPECKEH